MSWATIEELFSLAQAKLNEAPPWIAITIIMVGAIVSLWFVRHIIISNTRKLAAKGSRRMLTNALRMPLSLVVVSLLINLLHSLLLSYQIGDERTAMWVSSISKVLLIVALITFVDRVAQGSLQRLTSRHSLLQNSSALVKGATRLFILAIGLLVLLSTLGISVTPIVASLGITSLAVALALQPTLENFFSGVQLVTDKPFRVGDYIELESGEQGFIEKIGWRSTWIKMLPNNIIVMPNSKLSNSKVINYFYPTRELSVPVDVGVHYDSDLEHVERVTVEVAKEILETHEYGVDTYEPFMNYHTFDNSSINFTVILRAQEYFHRFFITSAFIKALHKRYKEEGIVIPYPIRALNIAQEGVDISELSAKHTPEDRRD